MPGTTAQLLIPYPANNDGPTGPAQIQQLADYLDALIRPAGATTSVIAYPGADVTIPNAWTSVITGSITLTRTSRLRVQAGCEFVSTGAGDPQVMLSLRDDPAGANTDVWTSGQHHLQGSSGGAQPADAVQMLTPVMDVVKAAGTWTFGVQGHKNANGAVSALKSHVVDGYTCHGSFILIAVQA